MYFTLELAPILYPLVSLWFVVALITSIVKSVKANKIQDPAQKKIAKSRAWKITLYPVLVLIIIVVLNGLANIAGW
jgi:hypothetical protein